MINKFKGLAIEYWTALILRTAVQVALYSTSFLITVRIFSEIIPDIFCLQAFGISMYMNNPTWYISAMLISMLPLLYILFKNKDFFIYIFSPLVAMLLLGYMYNQDYVFVVQEKMYGDLVTGAIIRAVCGLCFGVVAWSLSEKLKECIIQRRHRIFITFLEIILYIIFFSMWFFLNWNWNFLYYSSMLILPIALAITFSGVSYTSELFKSKLFKPLGSLSLAIYLNHSGAVQIVDVYFKGKSYKFCLLISVLLTIAMCVVYYGIVYLIKFIIKKHRKTSVG